MRSKYEIKAHKELEADGYIVDYKIRPSRFAKVVDFFSLFDLIAVKKGKPVRWISIKGHAGAPRAHQAAIKAFPLPKSSNIKEVWVYWPSGKCSKSVL